MRISLITLGTSKGIVLSWSNAETSDFTAGKAKSFARPTGSLREMVEEGSSAEEEVLDREEAVSWRSISETLVVISTLAPLRVASDSMLLMRRPTRASSAESDSPVGSLASRRAACAHASRPGQSFVKSTRRCG